MATVEETYCNVPFSKRLPELSAPFATLLANAVAVLQEYLAVTFQLVCLSRLETTAGIQSVLVLFLTLVVFTGPYLNGWLLYMDFICFKKWGHSSEDAAEKKKNVYMTVENLLVGLVITGAHILGSLTAWGVVKDLQHKGNSTIIWEKTAPATAKNNDLGVHFLEEMFGVLSLLIGCAYLLWLKNLRREKQNQAISINDVKLPKIEIKFYLQLTLLVAAVSQAFPSAYLSPHILCYKTFTQAITADVCLVRLAGGAAALVVACMWLLLRVVYRRSVQNKVDENHEHHAKGLKDYNLLPTNEKEPLNLKPLIKTPDLSRDEHQRMPPMRLSMHGGSYY